MSKIYSTTNRIKFTDIPEKYAIPRVFKAKACEVHSTLVNYVCNHYKDTKRYRQLVADALNRLTYCIMENELPSFDWVLDNPIETMPNIDLELVESTLNGFYLTPEAIEWDVVPANSQSEIQHSELNSKLTKEVQTLSTKKESMSVVATSKTMQNATDENQFKNNFDRRIPNRPLHDIKEQQRKESSNSSMLTPKSDLYIQPPRCARFDVNKVWKSANINGDELVIYVTLPEIPETQNDISVTTNPERMTDTEFMRLYPNHIIPTRGQSLYQHYNGIEYDSDLGCIIPIEGFTSAQVKDNIVKYPHLYKIKKMTDQGLQPFFHTIEINGELRPILDVWDSLTESAVIPKDSEFIKEYVIRRYLLEEEHGIKHDYPIVGGLDPFLTLFMPATKYIEMGYSDTLSIVKQCVVARINYKRSRNPILRRIEKSV